MQIRFLPTAEIRIKFHTKSENILGKFDCLNHEYFLKLVDKVYDNRNVIHPVIDLFSVTKRFRTNLSKILYARLLRLS